MSYRVLRMRCPQCWNYISASQINDVIKGSCNNCHAVFFQRFINGDSVIRIHNKKAQ